MKIKELKNQIILKRSFLCVGLDVDLDLVPKFFLKFEDPLFEFSKKIIDITAPFVVAYKPNLAFFESYGPSGMNSLLKVMEYLNINYPKIFTIADAKRGDIGNTSKKYAQTFFETYNFDSITISPFMGKDSVEPFLKFKNKYVILLTLTSNPGSKDFQLLKILNKNNDNKFLFEKIIETSKEWKDSNRLMYVIGANQNESIRLIRKKLPESFFLIPGIGFQGGDLDIVCENGFNNDVGILVNSSRGIIYSFTHELSFENEIINSVKKIQNKMDKILLRKKFYNA
jgi:orotidine-5'-phosphate decarboxylase